MINNHGINIIGNYIVGFPEDTYETITSTLNLALELNTEMMNVYPCQALPGSKLFTNAKIEGLELPQAYEEFAFLSYECKSGKLFSFIWRYEHNSLCQANFFLSSNPLHEATEKLESK